MYYSGLHSKHNVVRSNSKTHFFGLQFGLVEDVHPVAAGSYLHVHDTQVRKGVSIE